MKPTQVQPPVFVRSECRTDARWDSQSVLVGESERRKLGRNCLGSCARTVNERARRGRHESPDWVPRQEPPPRRIVEPSLVVVECGFDVELRSTLAQDPHELGSCGERGQLLRGCTTTPSAESPSRQSNGRCTRPKSRARGFGLGGVQSAGTSIARPTVRFNQVVSWRPDSPHEPSSWGSCCVPRDPTMGGIGPQGPARRRC
jgi:hypothetical protein